MKYAKGFVAVLTAAAVSVSTLVVATSPAGKAVTVALAVLGALAVYLVPNKPVV